MAEINSSLEKALKILDLFQSNERITATEVVRETGFSNASVLRVLNTLEMSNYIYRDRVNGSYYLAGKIYMMGRNTSLKRQLINVVEAPVKMLVRRCGFAVAVSIRRGNKAVTVYRQDPQRGISLSPNVDTVLSLNCTASGKILTAFDEDYKKLIDSINFVKLNEKTIVDKEDFIKQIERVRISGVAFDAEEITEGLVCAAMPVLDKSGIVICGVSASGYKGRMMRDMERTIEFLKQATSQIEKLMR